MKTPEAYYGLPSEVKFCKKCVISNQRPNAANEFRYSPKTGKDNTKISDDGVCEACKYAEMKENEFDWKKRGKVLQEICDRHRSNDGSYDCITPGSGGKDSRFVSHILKEKYGMNPLTVTWPPSIYTDIGRENFDSWLSFHDNITIKPNQKIHRLLTKLAFKNLCHPFQPFIIGQRKIAPCLALKNMIPLIFYGEPHAEYGHNIEEAINLKPCLPQNYYSDIHDLENIYLGGVSVRDLIEIHNIDRRDLNQYLPLTSEEMDSFKIEYHYLGYYLKWDPQEVFYYASDIGYKVNPERTDGTYSKYSSLDDQMDGLHYFTTFIKFGLGRATYDAAQEIRCGKITREEGVALVKRYDGEFPIKYFKNALEYMDLTEDEFWEVIDKSRSPHLWRQERSNWKLIHQVS